MKRAVLVDAQDARLMAKCAVLLGMASTIVIFSAAALGLAVRAFEVLAG